LQSAAAPRGAVLTTGAPAPDFPVVPVPAGDPRAASSGGREVSWDLVRTTCVVLVMLYHATSLATFLHPELGVRALRFPLQVGASTLLVLSGYFTCASVRRADPARFWWGRFARIVPPFLVANLVIFAVQRSDPVPGWFLPQPGDLGANLLMLWNWNPRGCAFLDPSHWTVPLQLLAFTAAAVLHSWGAARRLSELSWAGVLVPIAQWPLRMANPPVLYSAVVDGIGMHRWHLFAAGVAIWSWSRGRVPNRQFAPLLGTCMAAQVLHSCTLSPAGIAVDWGSDVGVCLAVVVIAVAARGPRWDPFVPAPVGRFARWFAGISYGTFLLHQSIGYLVCHELQRLGARPGVQVAGMLAVGVLLGWALTRTVERPVHRFLVAGGLNPLQPRVAAAEPGTGGIRPPEPPADALRSVHHVRTDGQRPAAFPAPRRQGPAAPVRGGQLRQRRR
jgi:peptidoglycan/LPS O-acetylase OafA/YrhL